MIFSKKRDYCNLSFTWILATLILLFFSCQNDGKRDIKDYYYPMDEWSEGRVYEYQPVNNDSLPVEYWYFRKHVTDSATYMVGQFLDHSFNVRQFFSEEIVSNGVLMNEYSIYEYDSTGTPFKRSAEILAPNSFPFKVTDSTGVFLFKLKWQHPTIADAYLEFVRNRRFWGDAAYSFKGKSYDCVEFRVKELVDDFNNGHLEPALEGKELYAKNLGLVYYMKKEIENNFVLEYELKDTFSMETFEQKLKTYLGE